MDFRLLALPAFALLGLVSIPTIATAQTGWCARMQGGSENCGFATIDQCRATISGVGGTCIPNPRSARGNRFGGFPDDAGARGIRAEQPKSWRQIEQERRRAQPPAAVKTIAPVRAAPAQAAPAQAAPPPTAATQTAAPGSVAPAGGMLVSELDTKVTPALSRDGVRRVQVALKGKGFDPGPINGVVTPRLQTAVRTFQTAYGIDARGEIDNQTLLALGEADLASQSNR